MDFASTTGAQQTVPARIETTVAPVQRYTDQTNAGQAVAALDKANEHLVGLFVQAHGSVVLAVEDDELDRQSRPDSAVFVTGGTAKAEKVCPKVDAPFEGNTE